MFRFVRHHFLDKLDCDYRTEDIKFSPSGNRVAIAATDGCVLIFRVRLNARPIQVEWETELRSPSLVVTHGVDFLDENNIVVANRDGNLAFFSLNNFIESEPYRTVEPFYEMSTAYFGRSGVKRMLRERPIYCGPGSVRCSNGTFFVCCNYKNTVSAHGYQLADNILSVDSGSIVAHEGLEISDGVAISRDTTWLAASDHDHHRVIVYKRDVDRREHLTSRSKFTVACTLNDTRLLFPHGLCFDKSGQVLYVADAGSSHLYAFQTVDMWQTSMDTCTATIDAVDMEAFTKSQMAVPESVRMLEGGAKGIDIDPSGRYIVTTCRNQIIRFFEIDSCMNQSDFSAVSISPHMPSSIPELNNDIAISCIIDDVPDIWNSFIPWIATATTLARILPSNIHVHHVCPLLPQISKICVELGVQTHAVAPFDKVNPYTNKIVQCLTDFGHVRNVVLTDVDIAFAGRVPFDCLYDVVAGKSVDMENPSFDVMRKIFFLTNIKPLGIKTNKYIASESIQSFETFAGNFNGGLYVIPVEKIGEIGQRWAFWASWLIANIHLLERWYRNVDQVAFCLAISELNINTITLGNCWNFPVHIKLPPSSVPPWLVHHHARLTEKQELIQVVDGVVGNSIEKINSCIRAFRTSLNL